MPHKKKEETMSKTLITGSMALMLLAASTALADEGTDVRVGPVRVRVQAGPVATPAPPVQVQVRPALVPDVFVQAPNTRVRVHSGSGDATAELMKLPDYWIGLTCRPIDEPLRVQLGLPEGQGLIVENVMPEGPAATAGIVQHDVLVKAGETPLASLEDLIKAIDETKDTKMAVELYRGGKKQSLEVTPAKRPEQAQVAPVPAAHGADWDLIQKWIEQLHEGRPDRLHFFGPGIILPPHAKISPPLPADMTVVITKAGDDPTKITVTRGDEKWEVTEEELDKLPKDVRRHVEGILGHHVGDISIDLLGPEGKPHRFGTSRDLDRPGTLPKKPRLVPHPAEPTEDRLNKQLDEMQKRIEDLQKSLEQLRQQPAEEEQPDKV